MPKQIEQDDNGNWFYLPLTRLYGFKNESSARDFKISSDAIVANFRDVSKRKKLENLLF